jgi:hypothetical protein
MKPVAIYGMGPIVGTQPPDCETWVIWKADNLALADALFEIHTDWRNFRTNYAEDIVALGIPTYLPELPADVPNAVLYPLDEVLGLVGRYLESSIAYMLALAIYQKRPAVYLYGVTGADEYASQRPNLEYLIGFAKAVGVRVYPQGGSAVMRSNWADGLYGLEPI